MQLTSTAAKLFRPNISANTLSQTTLAILRVTLGVMMVHNGFDKLADIESFARAYVEYLGLPFPIFLSYVAAYTEVIAAPLVAMGLFTRFASLGLFGTMCVAMYHHISVAGLSLPYLELSAIYAASFFYFLVNGAGLYSFDALIANLLDSASLTLKEKQIMRLESSFEAAEAVKDENVVA
ncbi:DoxX family protein [Leptolyngbya iicbica]|uniref:DoxX family protein n=2 Tax=Cyanophyceae TaxID=3028117 RepID=A0A4Q7E9F3_9CYAN|nr:DoxX family protein [Leptolyngbya sp. LK]RZM79039.1 DoxX family protein [Leptolyngbya sp. LK]